MLHEIFNQTYEYPVSVIDLPGHSFSATPETLTEEVVEVLENQPSLPGVLIVQNGQLLGFITRLKLFERLGHRFGIELFLQKPIIQLKDLLRTPTQPLPGNVRIDEAINFALNRPAPDAYDPLLIVDEDGKIQLLDINLLLLAQSRAMASLSNVVGNLEQIDRLISLERDQDEIFKKILQLLRQVIPYHQAAILALDEQGMRFVCHSGYPNTLSRIDEILESDLYALVSRHHQAIYIPQARNVPAWKDFGKLGMPMAWIGLPILVENCQIGLLSISRNVERAFSADERETAQAFVQRIADVFKFKQYDKIKTCKEETSLPGNLVGNDEFPVQIQIPSFSLSDSYVSL